MKSVHPLKDAIILCLSDIEEGIGKNIFILCVKKKKIIILTCTVGDKLDHESDDWTDLVDRGGLIHKVMQCTHCLLQ